MKKNKQTNIVFTTTPLMFGEPIQLKLKFDDEASNTGRSKEQYFEKVLQDPSQFETKE